jgi:hypothetical protein
VYLQEAGYLLVKTSFGAGYAGWSFDVPDPSPSGKLGAGSRFVMWIM